MLKHLLVVGVIVGVVGWLIGPMGGNVNAQEGDAPQATVLLKSGERLAGEFEDIQGDEVYLRVSQAEDRRISIGEIALIDFAGHATGLPAAEYRDAMSNKQVLVLRGGARRVGTLVNVERRGEGDRTVESPIWVTFRTTDGRESRYRVGEITRLYLAAPPKAAFSMPVPPEPDVRARHRVTVKANTRWTPTNLYVRTDEFVTFRATGEVRLSRNAGDVATPSGSTEQRLAPDAPIPGDLAGALIGRIEGAAPFGIGDQTHPLRMATFGRLYLSVNDDDLNDNAGAFEVEMTVSTPPSSEESRRRRGSR